MSEDSTDLGSRAPRRNNSQAKRRPRRSVPSRYIQVNMPEELIQDLDLEYGSLPEEIRPANRSEAVCMCVRYFILKRRADQNG